MGPSTEPAWPVLGKRSISAVTPLTTPSKSIGLNSRMFRHDPLADNSVRTTVYGGFSHIRLANNLGTKCTNTILFPGRKLDMMIYALGAAEIPFDSFGFSERRHAFLHFLMNQQFRNL